MDEAVPFEELARRHLSSLYSYARTLARNDTEAEDLLQEALFKAFRARDTLKLGMNPKPWLFAIMRNAHIDRGRRERVRPSFDELWADEGEATGVELDRTRLELPPDPECILLRRLAIEDVREAIRRLPRRCREVVEMRDIEGLSYREIASVIGLPIGTVMSRLFRGRAQLRASLQGQPEPVDRVERFREL